LVRILQPVKARLMRVTLSGQVSHRRTKRLAEYCAARVPGVKEVIKQHPHAQRPA
jgi:osmotically-inducible protein OsmY